MNWDDLRFFVAAYRSQSLTAAARVLRCDHTTVSRRLSALEAALGSKLFTRTPEGLAPTKAAHGLVSAAETAERAMQAVERQASGHDSQVDGCVRLTVPEAFSGFIVSRLAELRERHPNLTVEVLPDSHRLDIARGEADVAFRFSATPQADVLVKKLCEINGAMYASESYLARRGAPSPVQRLRGHEVVAYGDALADVPGARWLAKHLAGATVVFRGNSLLSVLDAAVAGLGLTVVPCGLAERRPELRRLTPRALCSGTLSLAVHRDLARVARVRAVLNFLTEVVNRDRAQLTGS